MMFNNCGVATCKSTDSGFGVFEQSLRDRDSPSFDRKVLHKGCCGTLHGNSVRKERVELILPVLKKSSVDSTCSEDSSYKEMFMGGRRVTLRSHSTETTGSRSGESLSLPRRSSSAVTQRLYTLSTKAQSAKTRTPEELKEFEKKALAAGKKGAYTGSKSTSSLPRRIKLSPADALLTEIQQLDKVDYGQDRKKISIVSFLDNDNHSRRRSLIHGISQDTLDRDNADSDNDEEDDTNLNKKLSISSQSSTGSDLEPQLARNQFRNEHKILTKTKASRRNSPSPVVKQPRSNTENKSDGTSQSKSPVYRSSSTAPIQRVKQEARRARSSGSNTAPIVYGVRTPLSGRGIGSGLTSPSPGVGFGSTVSRFERGSGEKIGSAKTREKTPVVRSMSRDNVTRLQIGSVNEKNNSPPKDTNAKGESKTERKGSSGSTNIVDQVGKYKTNNIAKVDLDGTTSIVVNVSEHDDNSAAPVKKTSRGRSLSIEIRKSSNERTGLNTVKKTSTTKSSQESQAIEANTSTENIKSENRKPDVGNTDKERNVEKKKKSSTSNMDKPSSGNATKEAKIERGNSKSLNLTSTIIPTQSEEINQGSIGKPKAVQSKVTSVVIEQGNSSIDRDLKSTTSTSSPQDGIEHTAEESQKNDTAKENNKSKASTEIKKSSGITEKKKSNAAVESKPHIASAETNKSNAIAKSKKNKADVESKKINTRTVSKSSITENNSNSAVAESNICMTLDDSKKISQLDCRKNPVALNETENQDLVNKSDSNQESDGIKSKDELKINQAFDGSKRKQMVKAEEHIGDKNEINVVISDISSENSSEVSEREEDITGEEVDTSWVYQPSASDEMGSVSPQEVDMPLEIVQGSIEDAWDMFAAMEQKLRGGRYKDLGLSNDQARSEDEVSDEKAWLEAERVWLVHRGGFTAGRQVKESDAGEPLGQGQVRVRLDCNDEVVQVEEDDVERANPPTFDRVEDLALLRFLNESSVLHTLRQRYGNNLIYTYAGASLVSINPCTNLPIYSSKIITMFKGCKIEDMPPHIYSVAQSAYRALLTTKKDQSVALIGRSGSGKSTNFRHVVSYLALAGGESTILSLDKLSGIHTILEAFGNSRTLLNANATRFSQIFSVDYDHSGSIVSGSIQVLMLERNRVVRRPEGEPNFNVFYQLLAGLDNSLRREFQIDNLTEPNQLLTPLTRTDDKNAAAAAFQSLTRAAQIVGFSDGEWSSILSVLCSIYHLGSAGTVKGSAGRPAFNKPQFAHKAAHCLGVSLEDLSRAIFHGLSGSGGTGGRRSSRGELSCSSGDPADYLNSFIIGLYSEIFHLVVAIINRSIASGVTSAASILVLDTPGFQNPASCGRLTGAGFDELCNNYTQERLQLLFHDRSITALKERYENENIDIPDLEDLTEICTPAPLVQLIDRQSTLRHSQGDLSQIDKRGLLWLLDEESIYPGASDQTFVDRMLDQFGVAGTKISSEDLIKPGPEPGTFILQHFQGTNPVVYNSRGWLKVSRENIVCKQAINVLQESQDKVLNEMFMKYRSVGAASMSGSIVGAEGNQALRRASSIRRAFTSSSAGLKRHSPVLQVKFQTDSIIEQLRRTKIRFVHCYLPQHTAGLCDVKPVSSPASNLNIPLIRSQLRGSQLIDALRLQKVGFPECIGFSEFWRTFKLLGNELNIPDVEADVGEGEGRPLPGYGRGQAEAKSRVEALLTGLEVEPTGYRLGNTQVFLRTGILSRLEEEREEKLGEKIIRLQAVARGHIARNKLQKLKTQDIAIRCIQKNVEKFMGVRGWAWWRLLVKVSPLLNVQRTEERLKQREDEVEQLKQRLEKVERERKEFKDEAERNQARLSEMTADLTEEQNASTIATERLETEQAERMKLEREKADLISRNKTLNSNAERYELELMHSRTLDINGIEDGDGGVYRVKYERAMKDMDHMKKMMAQQHEDDLEQLSMLKKQLEKKLNDAYEEVDEQRQVGAQWKRKTQKIQGEMNDLRLLLEEQTSRNSLLEKKQRKFDTELAMVQEDRRQDQLAKEKVQKDLEHLRQEKNRMEDTMKGMKIDLESRDEKISALNREISDIQMGGATEDEVRSLKKTKKDLEMQLKDQEEELDDLAAQVQMLEGSKTKIEMEMAAIKKEHRREMTNRDEEIEEARASASKKVKILEQQLEQEHEERIMFLRERHELEQKIGTLQDMLERSGDEEQVAKLKKDLRKTKALLRDAQLLVEKTQNEGTNKVILRQLKNQLEDAEFARTAAMKARQNAELELADTQLQLEDVSRSKQDLEEKHLRVSREKAEFASQLQENEEELQDVMRKYKASVAAVSTDQITIQDQQSTIQELEEERNKLRDAVAELSSKLGNLEGENVSTAQHKRLELKIRELESKLELELTSRSRLETQIIRLKETIEKITKEKDEARLREQQSSDQIKKHSRQIREMKEDYVTVQGKEIELSQKKNDLEKQLEVAEAETLTVRSDLKLALKRIEDLQAALAGEMDSDNSDDNSDSSDDEMHSFLEHHRRAMSVQRERESMARESIVRESMGRDSSILRESVTREVRSNGARTFASIDESRESISMDASKLSSTIAEIDESQA